MESINDLQNQIIDEFSGFSDWMDRYSYIIDLGNSMDPLPEEQRTQDNLIDGCQSRLWLSADYRSGLVFFTADSDALLIRVLSGHTPQEILDADLFFIDAIGLREHLSPTRSNGLLSMVKQMRMYALAFKAKEVTK